MARMPGAQWIGPTNNRTPKGMVEIHGLALHIQEGTEAGTEEWFQDPASKASAHFLNPRQGGLRQLIDTADRAWAQAAGNPYWISLENEGRSGERLTSSQVENAARLFAWLHQTYGVPLVATLDPMGRGLAYHGMGGVAWGNHPDCPGVPIVGQRGDIVYQAQVIADAQAGPVVSLARLREAANRDPGLPQGGTTWPADVRVVERALRHEGFLPAMYASDGSWGSRTVSAYSRWQQSPLGGGYSGTRPGEAADGHPGMDSLKRLGARNGFSVRA